MTSFEGRTAIVTGGAGGIGRGTVLALAARGANVVIADRDAEAGAAVAGEVGAAALFVPFDVVATPFERLRDAALERFGRIDIVMNNVGVITQGLPEHLPEEEWRRIIEIDLMSVVRSIRVFVPHLIAQGSGHIVNTASFAGLFTYSFDRMPYAVSKAAIVQMSEGLALYLRPKGVHVTLLCPGPVATNIAKSVKAFGPPTELRTPGPQFALMDPRDVGEMVAEAILAKRFLLPTHPEVTKLLVWRAQDWDGFLNDQIEHPHIAVIPTRRG